MEQTKETADRAKPTAGPCPDCREHHPQDRGLSFDGKGVNGCDMYRGRLATFNDSDAAERWGVIFAEAGTVHHETGRTPRQLADDRARLLAALEWFLAEFRANEHDVGWSRRQQGYANARMAIDAAKGEQS